MNALFNSEQTIELILSDINLTHLENLFKKKNVTFPAFVNSTEEDLIYVGVTDQEERNTILEAVKSLQYLYKDVNNTDIDPDKALLVNLSHLNNIGIVLQNHFNHLVRGHVTNTQATQTVTASQLYIDLIERNLSQLDQIENNLRVINNTKKEKNYSNYKKVGFIITSIISCSILIGFLFRHNHRLLGS